MCVSTMASQPVEAIAQVAAGPLWFQLYVQPGAKTR
jgi:4-hydroxymandelate oxidase